jgi:FkbM family methyltransferase
MHGVYIGDKKVLVSTIWGGKLIVSSEDLSLSPDLIINGVYDIQLTNYLCKNITAGQVVVDIGSNIGYFTILMGYLVGKNGKVISYEANDKVFSFLKDNVSLNYLSNHVETYNNAVYSYKTKIKFYATERFQGNSSIHKHSDEYNKMYSVDKTSEVEVEADKLDNLLGSIDHINFIKIDVEGAEYHVLKGMTNLIGSGKVDTVSFELNKMALQNDWDLLKELLAKFKSEYGVEFFVLTSEGDMVSTNLEEIFLSNEIPNVLMKSKNNRVNYDKKLTQDLYEITNTCIEAVTHIRRQLSGMHPENTILLLRDLVQALNEVRNIIDQNSDRLNINKEDECLIALWKGLKDILDYYQLGKYKDSLFAFSNIIQPNLNKLKNVFSNF